MNELEAKKKKLRELSQLSKEKTDELLENEILSLIMATQTNLELLRPRVTDQESYDQLIAAVAEYTRRNESLAALKERLHTLGAGVIRVGKEAVRLLKI